MIACNANADHTCWSDSHSVPEGFSAAFRDPRQLTATVRAWRATGSIVPFVTLGRRIFPILAQPLASQQFTEWPCFDYPDLPASPRCRQWHTWFWSRFPWDAIIPPARMARPWWPPGGGAARRCPA